jgi:hypothetical protein
MPAVPPTLLTSGSISTFGKDLVVHCSVVETVGSGLQPIAQSTFFLTSLRQAGIQIDSNQPDFYAEQTDDNILASLNFSHDSDFL